MSKSKCMALFLLLGIWPSTHAPAGAQELTLPPVFAELGAAANAPPPDLSGRGPITLVEAVSYVLYSNPQLLAAKSRVYAAEARWRQTGLYQNPEATVEIEDLGRTRGGGPSQTTMGISQPLELWGKRGAKREVARSDIDLVRSEATVLSLDLYKQTVTAFSDVLGAQLRLQYAEERLELARQVENAVSIKVREGAAPEAEHLRAKAAVGLAEIGVEQAEGDIRRSSLALGSLWSDTVGLVLSASGDLANVDEIPPAKVLIPMLADNPEIKSSQTVVRGREAGLRLAKAMARPDISVGAGYRRLHDDGDNAVLLNISLPFGLFNRNQGGIQEATAQISEAKAETDASFLRLCRDLMVLCTTFQTQTSEITHLRNQVLPAAEQAVQELNEEYRQGRQPYINILDAQREQAELRTRQIEVMVSRSQTVAEIESMIGHRISSAGR